MRSLVSIRSVLLFLVFALLPLPANAQTAGNTGQGIIPHTAYSIDEDIVREQKLLKECQEEGDPHLNAKFGAYGYMHCLLHKYGSVDSLTKAAGQTCCDGGDGGECRATSVKVVSDEAGNRAYYAKFEFGWESLRGVKIHTDVKLPPRVDAMVCASKTIITLLDDGTTGKSATIYCFAMKGRVS